MTVTCKSCGQAIPKIPYYTIQERDVRRKVIFAWGTTWLVSNVMGRILPCDVGKRIYRVRDNADVAWFLQAESDKQFQERKEKYGRA